MAVNKKAIMWGGLALLGAVGIYEYLKKKKAAEADAAATAASETPPFSNTSIQTVTSLPGGSTSASAPQTGTAAPLTPAIDANTLSLVQNWATTDGRAPVLQMMAAMVPAEYAGMANLIQAWDSTPPGQQFVASADETKFWNDLRDKYDPSHQSW